MAFLESVRPFGDYPPSAFPSITATATATAIGEVPRRKARRTSSTRRQRSHSPSPPQRSAPPTPEQRLHRDADDESRRPPTPPSQQQRRRLPPSLLTEPIWDQPTFLDRPPLRPFPPATAQHETIRREPGHSSIHVRGSTFSVALATPTRQLRLFQTLLSQAVRHSALARRKLDAAAERDREARERWMGRRCHCGRCTIDDEGREAEEGDREGRGEEELSQEEVTELEEAADRLGHLTSLVRRSCDLDRSFKPPDSSSTGAARTVSPLFYHTMLSWLRACLRAERDWRGVLEGQEEQRRCWRQKGREEPREAILIVKRREDLRALRNVALFTTDVLRLLQAERDLLCPPPSYPETQTPYAPSTPSSADRPPSYDTVTASSIPDRQSSLRPCRLRLRHDAQRNRPSAVLDEWLDEPSRAASISSTAPPGTPRLPATWAFEPLPSHILEI